MGHAHRVLGRADDYPAREQGARVLLRHEGGADGQALSRRPLARPVDAGLHALRFHVFGVRTRARAPRVASPRGAGFKRAPHSRAPASARATASTLSSLQGTRRSASRPRPSPTASRTSAGSARRRSSRSSSSSTRRACTGSARRAATCRCSTSCTTGTRSRPTSPPRAACCTGCSSRRSSCRASCTCSTSTSRSRARSTPSGARRRASLLPRYPYYHYYDSYSPRVSLTPTTTLRLLYSYASYYHLCSY